MIEISIDGMSCQNCVRHVREALEGIEGVDQVVVDLESGQARVEISADPGDERIKAVLDEEGYDVTAIARN